MRYAVAVQIPKKKKKKKPHTINGQILFGMKNEFVAPSRMVLPVLFLCNKDIPSCGRPSPCSTVEVFFFFFLLRRLIKVRSQLCTFVPYFPTSVRVPCVAVGWVACPNVRWSAETSFLARQVGIWVFSGVFSSAVVKKSHTRSDMTVFRTWQCVKCLALFLSLPFSTL